jgi:rhamnosyltransferase
MKPVCSIVIRAYNEEKHISRILDGIAHQTIHDVQVILVDSGSSDRTVKIAQSYGTEVIKINPRNFTFGKSLNSGIAKSRADVVVIASAHVYPVYPDWLEKLIEPFKDDQVALTYGRQRGSKESHFSENQVFAHWYPDATEINQNHPFCNNANAAIRRVLWEKQPYSDHLPALEDLAWAKWVVDKGFKITYVAEAEIIHVHNESWKNIFNRYKREGMAFKQIYPQESFSLWDVIRFFLTNVDSDLHEAFRQKKISAQTLNIIKFRWNQFWGTYQGYRQSGPLTWQLKRSFYYPRNNDSQSDLNGRRNVEPIPYEMIKKKKNQNELSEGGRNGSE